VGERKKEHELAIDNVFGSNLFNTLAIVGIAAVIQPVKFVATFLFSDDLLILGYHLYVVSTQF
jgi:cation:H+ antiporter|tara:strand:- start:419 stop:607 length:189 start_codon:yes stop_codon:yes gene_type:complete